MRVWAYYFTDSTNFSSEWNPLVNISIAAHHCHEIKSKFYNFQIIVLWLEPKNVVTFEQHMNNTSMAVIGKVLFFKACGQHKRCSDSTSTKPMIQSYEKQQCLVSLNEGIACDIPQIPKYLAPVQCQDNARSQHKSRFVTKWKSFLHGGFP